MTNRNGKARKSSVGDGGVLYMPQASQEEQVLLLLHLLLPIFPVVIDSLCEWATKILN